ncbi:hypothetical protein [Lyngbya confervoides]|uniref:Lipoprotein n=1 Tax=Lyngbya confervoides BDU141951 TaxID=1574623 RepID=A0ABD4T757_9CYAN|nr:hypothetical protein [Lyngbya confervoides]MCM1984102.1 hypothetical protein [Lyngbya confervoides BDU141951]
MARFKPLLLLLPWLGVCPPAMAQPDVPVQTLVEWSQDHLLLAPLQKVDKVRPQDPDFESQLVTSRGKVRYEVRVDPDDFVQAERIQYRPQCFEADTPGCKGSIQFDPEASGNGWKLIEFLWGSDVLEDFRGAKLMLTDTVSGTQKWYQGQRYNYETWHFRDNLNAHFSVISKRSSQAERIQAYQTCLKEMCQFF